MKNFFKGISFTQVLAGSLAAVTSFLLASKIGIAGSVIGVAIGSIVSAVASQLYQNVIHASSKKLSEVNPNNSSKLSNDEVETLNMYPASSAEARKAGYKVAGDDASMAYFQQNNETNSGRTISSKASNPELENTRVLELSALRKQREEDIALSEGSVSEPMTLSQAVRETYGANLQEHSNRSSRSATIVIAIISALVAVILTAGVVLFITQGRGTDNINQPTIEKPQQPQNQQSPRVNKNNNKQKRNESDSENHDLNDEDANKSNGHENGDNSSSGHSENETGGEGATGGAGANSGDSLGAGSGSVSGSSGSAGGNSGGDNPADGSGVGSGTGAGNGAGSGAGSGAGTGSGESAGGANGNS